MPAVSVRSRKQNPQLQEKIGIIQRQMEFVKIRERKKSKLTNMYNSMEIRR